MFIYNKNNNIINDNKITTIKGKQIRKGSGLRKLKQLTKENKLFLKSLGFKLKQR